MSYFSKPGVQLRYIPREVTAAPPSDVTLPPQVADVWLIEVTAAVVSRGTETTGSAGVSFFEHPWRMKKKEVVMKSIAEIVSCLDIRNLA